MVMVVGGRNPGGTARWYSPAGAGTRHLTRGGGSNHLHLAGDRGRAPSRRPCGRAVRRRPGRLHAPARAARRVPSATPERLARLAGRARLSSPARVGWAGTAAGRPARFGGGGGGWAGALSAGAGQPGLARGLGGTGRGERAGARPSSHRRGAQLCLARRHLPPAVDCWPPAFVYKSGAAGPGRAEGLWGWPSWVGAAAGGGVAGPGAG